MNRLHAMSGTAEEPNDPIELCIGGKGRWQYSVCILVMPLRFTVAWLLLSYVYLDVLPEYSCRNQEIEACSILCEERVFDNGTFTNTIVSEWDLVCERAQMPGLAQMFLMVGVSIGSVLFGSLADRFGRRRVLLLASAIQGIFGVAAAFVNHFFMFTILRLICAAAAGGNLIVNFILIMEIIGKEWRTVIIIFMQLPIILGHVTLPIWAYFIRDWRYLEIAISVPAVLCISYYWVLPESPRWLIATGRHEEAIEVLQKAAKMNKLPIEDIPRIIQSSLEYSAKQEKTGDVRDLLRTKNIRKRSLIVFVNWIVLGLAFYSLSEITTQMGDIFLNIMVPNLVQVPWCLSFIYFLNRFGRRKCLITLFIVAGICLLPTPFLLDFPLATSILGGIAFMSSSMNFSIVFIFTGELYPTVIRNTAIGTCSMFARFGAMMAPFFSSLSLYERWLPSVLLAILSLFSAAICLLLPETNKIVLQNSVGQVEMNVDVKHKDDKKY